MIGLVNKYRHIFDFDSVNHKHSRDEDSVKKDYLIWIFIICFGTFQYKQGRLLCYSEIQDNIHFEFCIFNNKGNARL